MFESSNAATWYHSLSLQKTDPTPSQIRQECEQIQATWNERERQRRAAWAVEAEFVLMPKAVDDDDAWRFTE